MKSIKSTPERVLGDRYAESDGFKQTWHLSADAKERAHGDGIMVSFDSPEAFEEIFWRTFCAKDYIFKDHLAPHKANEEAVDQFRIFVQQIIDSRDTSEQTRYLSKNNGNVFRSIS